MRVTKWAFGWIAAGVLVLDQWSKWWAVGALTRAFENDNELGLGEKLVRFGAKHPVRSEAVAVWDNFWHFRYVENPGAAWGFLSNSASVFRTPFFLVVSLVAMVFIVLYFRRTEIQQIWLRLALALVFGGAIGNFIDRARLGYVIDFIDFYYGQWHWPAFNVADSAITVGVVLMLLDVFRGQKTTT